VADEAVLQTDRDEFGVDVEVDALDGRVGWEPERSRTTSSERSASGCCARHVRAPSITLPCTKTTRSIKRSHDVTNYTIFGSRDANQLLQTRWYAPLGMTPDAASSPHSLATASGLLLGALGAAMAAGALVGWIFGGWGIGLLIGAVVGIPLGVVAVYVVYSREETT